MTSSEADEDALTQYTKSMKWCKSYSFCSQVWLGEKINKPIAKILLVMYQLIILYSLALNIILIWLLTPLWLQKDTVIYDHKFLQKITNTFIESSSSSSEMPLASCSCLGSPYMIALRLARFVIRRKDLQFFGGLQIAASSALNCRNDCGFTNKQPDLLLEPMLHYIDFMHTVIQSLN